MQKFQIRAMRTLGFGGRVITYALLRFVLSKSALRKNNRKTYMDIYNTKYIKNNHINLKKACGS